MTVKTAHREAVVAALLRYRVTYGGTVPGFVLDQIAERSGVSTRTLRRWLDEHDAAEAAKPAKPKPRKRAMKANTFALNEAHLVEIRSWLNIKAAHKALFPEEQKGSDGYVSYSTFARAFKNLPPSIRDGIMGGWDAMSKRQVYLSTAAPHRNHTWHLDHTEADIWVSIRGGRIIRPHVSVVRDNATSMRLAAVAYQGRPNEDAVCDLLATAALDREYQTADGPVQVGGLPVQLVLDNGMEHFAEAITKGALMLGVVIHPTKPFYKHQNGTAEGTFSGLNKQLLKGLPGYTHGGVGDDGKPLIAPRYADQVDPKSVLPIESFQKHLDAWLVEQNTTTPVLRLGKQVPLTAWRDDPTEINRMPDPTLRALVTRKDVGHTVNAEGIRFRNVDYTHPDLGYYRERGLKLTVGYLARETRFIEVFDEQGWICRATDRTLLKGQERQEVLRGRERDLNLLKRVNAAANQERAHRAETEDTDVYDGDDQDVESTQLEAEFKRVDPTKPKRRKRQRAPSRVEAKQRRADKKTDASRQRIAQRPGANFGEDATP